MKDLIVLQYPKVRTRSQEPICVWDWDLFANNKLAYTLENLARTISVKDSERKDLINRLQEELTTKELQAVVQQLGEQVFSPTLNGVDSLITLNNHTVEAFNDEKFVVVDVTNRKQLQSQRQYVRQHLPDLSPHDLQAVDKFIGALYENEKGETDVEVVRKQLVGSWLTLDF